MVSRDRLERNERLAWVEALGWWVWPLAPRAQLRRHRSGCFPAGDPERCG